MRIDDNLTFLLRHISYLKFTHLEYAIHWFFTIFTELSSHHYNLNLEDFHHSKKEILYPSAVNPIPKQPQSYTPIQLVSGSLRL